MATAVSVASRLDLQDFARLWSDELLANGYIIIPDLINIGSIKDLEADLHDCFRQTPFCEGGFYGNRTKRFHRLLVRSANTAAFVQHELIMAIVEQVLKPHCDNIQLNLTQALEVHPGSRAQVPHRDQDMWGGVKGDTEYLVNVMWPFTQYDQTTGATVLWPESHKCPGDMLLPDNQAISANMKPGSALIFLGSTLHGAGENSSQEIRRGMIISYCLGWLKPYENQWLSYPPEVAKHFQPDLAALVGYRQHRPNLGNFDGQCPSILLEPNVPEFLHAVDNLRPDQQQLVEDFYAGRLTT